MMIVVVVVVKWWCLFLNQTPACLLIWVLFNLLPCLVVRFCQISTIFGIEYLLNGKTNTHARQRFNCFVKLALYVYLWWRRYIKHQDRKLQSWCPNKPLHVTKNLLVNADDLLSGYTSVIASVIISFQLSKPGDSILRCSHVPPWATLGIAYINLRPSYDMLNNMSSNTVLVWGKHWVRYEFQKEIVTKKLIYILKHLVLPIWHPGNSELMRHDRLFGAARAILLSLRLESMRHLAVWIIPLSSKIWLEQ